MARVVDAEVLREAMTRYLDALRAHREELDSLNVFPVPDGDTGTNLFFTQRAVTEALDAVDAADLAVLGEAVSRSALMSARGNSGVILSQVLRGLCARLCRNGPAGPEALAGGVRRAADEARAAVAEPVEGTVLTVLDAVAVAAEGACLEGASCEGVAEAALTASLAAVEETRERLPVLRQEGVVDAGALGLTFLLDALLSALRAAPLRVAVGPPGPVGTRTVREATAASGSSFGFEVMYLLECDDAAVRPLRQRLGRIGDSVVVVGGRRLYTVHVHTDEPGRAVEESFGSGRPRDIRITSLDRLVAVAPGEGAARLFRSLGAEVVAAEEGLSAEDLRRAIDRTGAAGALVLTNGVDLPVEEALAGEEVRILATGSVLEGLAAAGVVWSEASLEESEIRAREAADAVAGAEVAQPDPAAVVAAVRSLHRDGSELVTLLAGRRVSGGDAERAAGAVRDAFPRLEVEVHRGDQSGSAYLVGVE